MSINLADNLKNLRKEKNVSQGNWVEQWGFEIGCSVSVECYQNKLVILKD